MGIEDLIAAVSQLNGPNRGIDFAIAQAVGYTVLEDGEEYLGEDGQSKRASRWYNPSGARINRVPFFTLKIDEAIALSKTVLADPVAAVVWEPSGAKAQLQGGPVCYGASPSIALCAAILSHINQTR